MVQMRRWRHKGIGMNKAKKKRILRAEPAPDHPIITENDDVSDGEGQLPPHVCVPNPDPLPDPAGDDAGCSSDPVPPSSADGDTDTLKAHGAELQARLNDATRYYEKVKRRWERKIPWVVDGNHADGPHSWWRHSSEVVRDELRLAKMDSELIDARRDLLMRRSRWLRWRTFIRLGNRRALRGAAPPDSSLDTMYERARTRVVNGLQLPRKLSGMWPRTGPYDHVGFSELIARSVGLAIAYGVQYNDPGQLQSAAAVESASSSNQQSCDMSAVKQLLADMDADSRAYMISHPDFARQNPRRGYFLP